MEATKNLIKFKKNIVNLIFLVLFISLIININQNFPYYYNSRIRVLTYAICSVAAMFYIHSLVLFPVLQLKDRKSYKRYVFIACIVYVIFLLLFYFINHENLIGPIYTNSEPFIRKLTKILVLVAPPFIATLLLSYIYSAIILAKKALFVFLEFFVNLIIVSLLYALAVDVDRGTSTFLLTIVLIVFYVHVFYVAPIKITRNDTRKYWQFITGLSAFYLIAMLSVFSKNISRNNGLDASLAIFFNLLGVLCLIYILSFIYSHVRIKLKNREKIFTLKLGAKDSELQLLKSQVNPHFLFNTLNSLYATALEENAPKTAKSTAKLANLIRYMQNDISKDFIPLENEIKYLEDYIAIQKIRCEVAPEVKTHFKNIDGIKISPGLLIPFVENAFKYGIDPSKPSKLKVSVICRKNTIYFECTNSYDDTFKTYYKEQGFGIGITNTKQRLELVYPKKHTFEIVKENQLFMVKLEILSK